MRYRHLYLLEKFQVQLTTVAGLAVVYFAIWPILRPWDPQGPVTFVPTGGLGDVAVLGGVIAVLAGACAVMTTSSRPEGALLATLVAVGGISLRSASVRALLWRHEGNLPRLYGQLILEVLILAGVLLVAAAVIDIVRGLIATYKPKWVWQDPVGGPSEGRDKKSSGTTPGPQAQSAMGPIPARLHWIRSSLLIGLISALGTRHAEKSAGKPRESRTRPPGREGLTRSLSSLLLGLFVSMILLTVMLKSTERGQILFALLVSFMLGALISHQVFSAPYSIVAWVTPTIVAIAYYALAANAVSTTAGTWMHVPSYGYVLPIDWLTAGTGGAVLGYWISARIREARHIEDKAKQGK